MFIVIIALGMKECLEIKNAIPDFVELRTYVLRASHNTKLRRISKGPKCFCMKMVHELK